jgi:hypothetical protein
MPFLTILCVIATVILGLLTIFTLLIIFVPKSKWYRKKHPPASPAVGLYSYPHVFNLGIKRKGEKFHYNRICGGEVSISPDRISCLKCGHSVPLYKEKVFLEAIKWVENDGETREVKKFKPDGPGVLGLDVFTFTFLTIEAEIL